MKEVKKNEEQWDRRKILLFFIVTVILLIVGYQIKTITLEENALDTKDSVSLIKSDVKGASVSNQSLQKDLKKDIQDQINSLKSEAENINIVDIASSSPQVQKVINDLKALQDYPSNQLREVCEKVCRGL